MFKTAIKQRPILLCCIFISFFFAIIQVSTVQAANRQAQTPQAAAATPTPTPTPTATEPTPTPGTTLTPTVTLSQPGSAHAIGHPGTKVTISLAGFGDRASVSLYTATNPNQCTPNGSGLAPFAGYETVSTDNGNRDLNNIPWSSNANQPTTVYYICAIAANTPGVRAVSPQSFTVAQAVTVTPSSPTVQPGNPITITGENWLPAQKITVAVTANGQNNTLVQGTTSSDNSGHFSIDLTIPANATSGTYAISAVAPNEPTMRFEQDNMLIVGAATATASPVATSTATPTANNSNSGGGGGSGLTVLTFITGGLGILLIIIGVIMFAASSPPAPIR